MTITINIMRPTDLLDSTIEKYVNWYNQEYPVIIDRITITIAKKAFWYHKNDWKVLLAKDESIKSPVGIVILQYQEENEIWFTIVVNRRYQQQGIGSKLLTEAKKITDNLHGWVIPFNNYKKQDGSDYKSPINFYLKNGFKIGKDNYIEKKDLYLVEVYY